MSRLIFSVRTFSEVDATAYPGTATLSGQIWFTLQGNYGTNPQIRVYEVGNTPDTWVNVTPAEIKKLGGYLPGLYQLDYRDSNGVRALAKLKIHSIAELACLPNDGYLELLLGVFADGFAIVSYSGEAAVNASAFEGVITAPKWTDAELTLLGITDNIDEVKYRLSSEGCTLTVAEDVYIGSDATPEFTASIAKTDVTAPGAQDGTITVTVSGGSTPYSFIWNDGETTQNRTGLGPGTYTVIVSDDDGRQIPLEVTITEPSPVVEDLTEELLIEVRPAPCKPVTLCWLNSLGAYETYCFEDLNGTFEHEVKTKIDAEYERYVEDLETDTNSTGITSKTIERTMRLGADSIDADIFVGLLDLVTSPAVFMLTERNPLTWLSVKVSPGTFRYSEYDRALEFTIELPNMFVQRA